MPIKYIYRLVRDSRKIGAPFWGTSLEGASLEGTGDNSVPDLIADLQKITKKIKIHKPIEPMANFLHHTGFLSNIGPIS